MPNIYSPYVISLIVIKTNSHLSRKSWLWILRLGVKGKRGWGGLKEYSATDLAFKSHNAQLFLSDS